MLLALPIRFFALAAFIVISTLKLASQVQANEHYLIETDPAVTKCYHQGADTKNDCSKSFDRLWDIRWRVCNHVEAFGFNKGTPHQAWVTNPDCEHRGVFFRSDDEGHLDDCFDGTAVTIEQCQLNGCQAKNTCFASGVTHMRNQTFQTVRWLEGDGSPVPRPPPSKRARRCKPEKEQSNARRHLQRSRSGTVLLSRRDTSGIISSHFADGTQIYSVRPGRE
ncbi:hypothetical protein IE81DRAFT_320373 [Ceraceosorus guamensis]|uniref:Secreted protein n=1 Tax=Ceraceosorus guamensis TaxID=1522189 RepID=A0A316W7U4_9BASI|nr:hypothetical protein IE81DRAFT_320373 [Ceraceosorus guamensis]PWN45198.1 hypothetical protein IE81DRAFT_320373 [Ceraceosorus guamensis]